jgi:hypothetical protein
MFGWFKRSKASQPSLQPPPAAIEEASRTPNGWVYAIEGDFGDDAVPPDAIKGAWKVDAEGKIVGDFIPNLNYRSQTREAMKSEEGAQRREDPSPS